MRRRSRRWQSPERRAYSPRADRVRPRRCVPPDRLAALPGRRPTPGSDREPADPLPPLRARRGAHRRGDDLDRRGPRRTRPPAARRHLAALVPRCTTSSPIGEGGRGAPRPRRGAGSRGCTRSRPTRRTSRPAAAGFLGFTGARDRRGALDRGSARRGDGDVAAPAARVCRVARSRRRGECPGCSTSRTCSRTWPSSSAPSPTPASSRPRRGWSDSSTGAATR